MIDEAIEKLAILLQGKIPDKIDIDEILNENKQTLARMLNQLIDFMQETHDFIVPLSNGKLTDIKISPKNFFGSPFKELHSRLLHLTWQAKQVANGDFNQRVDFMGDFSQAFNSMIVSLDNHEKILREKINELEKALSHINRLEGILPICSQCKKIRLEGADPKKQEGWMQIEHYITEKTEALFSHSICPECSKKLYSEIV
ncbi:MAG: hypothetical protein SWO11_02930 [Thermodesulfobacteriota bacterium]|nr:hypothetical protein [Thermodesulfobacteriota bacterium]